jgi:chemotaxis protein MotB
MPSEAPPPGGSKLRRKTAGTHMESAGGMRWLLTYADMITLLLALFIILFAISTISKVKLQRLATEISGGFNNIDSINNPPNGGTTGTQNGRTEQANMAEVKTQLDRYIAKEHLQSKVQTRQTAQGLIITLLSDKAYYDSGSAVLRPETEKILDVVAAQLRRVKNDVRVEGNTDNVPIATSQYPTNWELSAARATGVTRYLVEHDKIAPTRLSFAGYGEYRPKFRNDSQAHRQQNRRVDIVILNGSDAAKLTTAEAEQ